MSQEELLAIFNGTDGAMPDGVESAPAQTEPTPQEATLFTQEEQQ